jgi:hypothetical protein
MMLPPFDPGMFPTSVAFYPPGLNLELHGDAVAAGAGPGLTLNAWVEPSSDRSNRNEANDTPEGKKPWNVFTPTQPPSGVDWLVVWNNQVMRTVARASDQSGGAGVLWRTECEFVS